MTGPESRIQLGKHVLDKGLQDQDGRRIGKVDDLVLEVGDGAIELVALVTGPLAYARTLGGWAVTLARFAFGLLGVPDPAPCEIPWGRVLRIGASVHVETDRRDRVDLLAERVYERVVSRIPWS